jgi:hypothetical protein
MEIYLAPDQIFYYVPKFTLEVARDRVEQKKTNLVAGTLGALISRPKPDEINMISVVNRYIPYWRISAVGRIKYDRNKSYSVLVGGAEVNSVTILGQDLALDTKSAQPAFQLNGIEHCLVENRSTKSFDGVSGGLTDINRYLPFARNLVEDIEHFAPEGAQVIPPQVKATAVVRQVLSEVIKPAQNAHVIHEERVDVETIELNFMPVYSIEYEWTGKGKRIVIDFDALTGDISNGKKLDIPGMGMLNRDLLFDISADAAGILVPGGSIAVKLVKAVVDRKKG